MKQQDPRVIIVRKRDWTIQAAKLFETVGGKASDERQATEFQMRAQQARAHAAELTRSLRTLPRVTRRNRRLAAWPAVRAARKAERAANKAAQQAPPKPGLLFERVEGGWQARDTDRLRWNYFARGWVYDAENGTSYLVEGPRWALGPAGHVDEFEAMIGFTEPGA